MIVRRLPSPDSELYHHGILGQRWGIRRYQNKDGTLTSAGRKHKGLIEQIRDNRRMKKVRRAKIEKAKAQQKEKEERAKRLQKAREEKKERNDVIKTGSAKDIQKFQEKLSNKDYEEALRRIDLKVKLDNLTAAQNQAKIDKTKARLENVMNITSTVANIANNAANVYGTLQKVGIIKEEESSIQKLTAQRDAIKLRKEISEYKRDKSIMDSNQLNKLTILQKKSEATKNIYGNSNNFGLDEKAKTGDITMKDLNDIMKKLTR